MNKILNNVKNHIVYYLFMAILVVLGAYLIYTNILILVRLRRIIRLLTI